jgi:hypothetical protein
MIKDRIVRVKLIKRFKEQRPISYVGKVIHFSDDWVVIDGYGLILSRGQSTGVSVDKSASRNVIARDNIESIHVLPDDFDLKGIRLTTNDQQIVMEVKGGQPSFLGELGEG